MSLRYRLTDGPQEGQIVTELPAGYVDSGTGSGAGQLTGDIPRSAHYLGSPKARYTEQVAEDESFDRGEGYTRD